MRVMVTGQFGVGKTSLVMILVGDEAPHKAQSTDGISRNIYTTFSVLNS
jgi:GTPase SAR1 family protein